MKNMLTLESFADWCEKQLAEKEYVFHDWNKCACGQYASSLGIERGAWGEAMLDDAIFNGGRGFWTTANSAAYDHPHTFGSLSLRLRQSSRSGS